MSGPPQSGDPQSGPPQSGDPQSGPPMSTQQLLGWIATANSEGYFDWTGLTYTLTYTYSPPGGDQPPVQVHYAMFGDGTFFGPPDRLAATMQVRGNPSTYKWDWIAPLVPNTQDPDDGRFPAPPLFTLGKVQGMIQGYAGGPSVHIKGSISVDGQNWTQCSTGPTSIDFFGFNSQSASLLSRSVLPASGFLDTASVEITPKVDLHGESAPTPPDGPPTQGGGLRFQIGDNAFPIVLAILNPFGLPQMGVHANKFVYNDSTLGVLTLGLGANVVGADQSDTQWLVDNDKVGWRIDPPIPGWIPYTKQAIDSSIFPVTNGTGGVAMYEGLPDDEHGFGNKTLILKVDGNDSQIAYIQTFFAATSKNYPGARPEDEFLGITVPPNWFYYYNKIYPATPAQYENGSQSHCDSDSSDPVQIHYPIVTGVFIDNDAYQSDVIPVFTNTYPSITWSGKLYVSGIHNYIYTVGHELGHKWDIEHGLVNRKYSVDMGTYESYDADGDGVLNSVEDANGLDPLKRDTTGAFGGDEKGDREVLACIHGLELLLNTKTTGIRIGQIQIFNILD